MGRNRTGVQTVEQLAKINVDYVRKLVKDKQNVHSGYINWTTGDRIGYTFNSDSLSLTLDYTHTNYYKVKTAVLQTIYIDEVPSNLGKGFNWYFICPRTGMLCKNLFNAYQNPYYWSKGAYKDRIYYHNQTESKENRLHTAYHTLNRKLNSTLENKNIRLLYNGKKTKKFTSIINAQNKLLQLDAKRMAVFNSSKFVRKFF